MLKRIGNYQYSTGDLLGHGSYGFVYRGINTKTNEPVAVKAIDLTKLRPVDKYYLEKEVELQSKIDSPHVVKLYERFEVNNQLIVILEYMGGGDMSKFIREKGSLPENIARRFLIQLAIGLRHIHDRNIIHRDLKPANILLTERSTAATIKIADFGFARYVADVMHSFLGTPLYMAPEILKRRPYNSRTDLWSVGMIFYEMLTGTTPFSDAIDQKSLIELIDRREISYPSHLSPQCIELLRGLLEKDNKKRFTWEHFFNHRYLQAGLNASVIDHQETWVQKVWIFDNHGEERQLYVGTKTTIAQIKREIAYQARLPLDSLLVLNANGSEYEDNRTLEEYKLHTDRLPLYVISRHWLTYPLKNVPEPFPFILKEGISTTKTSLQHVLAKHAQGNYSLEARMAEIQAVFAGYLETARSLHDAAKSAQSEITRCMRANEAQFRVFQAVKQYMVTKSGSFNETISNVLREYTNAEPRVKAIIDNFENSMKIIKATRVHEGLVDGSSHSLSEFVDMKQLARNFELLREKFAVGRQLHDSVTQAVNKMSETITIESGNNYAPPFKDELCKAFDCSKDIAVTLRAEIERLTIAWNEESRRIDQIRIAKMADPKQEQALLQRVLALDSLFTSIASTAPKIAAALKSCEQAKLLAEQQFHNSLSTYASVIDVVMRDAQKNALNATVLVLESLELCPSLEQAIKIPQLYQESLYEQKRRREWQEDTSAKLRKAQDFFDRRCSAEMANRQAFTNMFGKHPPMFAQKLFPNLLISEPVAVQIVSSGLQAQLKDVKLDDQILDDDFSMIVDESVVRNPQSRIIELERENAKLRAEILRTKAKEEEDSKNTKLVANLKEMVQVLGQSDVTAKLKAYEQKAKEWEKERTELLSQLETTKRALFEAQKAAELAAKQSQEANSRALELQNRLTEVEALFDQVLNDRANGVI